MKVLYYDCFAGISGDMNLGALIDLGVPPEFLLSELKKLNLNGYEILITNEIKMGISGTKVTVKLHDNHIHKVPESIGNSHHKQDLHHQIHNHEVHSKSHHHHHANNRNLSEIKKIIENSSLNNFIKIKSTEAFTLIAKAEAKIHAKSMDEIHFHEVGAIDSIIDIVGAAICVDYLKPDIILASSVQLGGGFVECAHGTFPVPAPATAELLVGVPVKIGKVEKETTTPTGAAILKVFVNEFKDSINLHIKKTAYGIGHRDLPIPNVLRVYLCEQNADNEFLNSEATLLECNIDDMNPEHYDYIIDSLLEAGAQDVFLMPIIMKKSRPATQISVLCDSAIKTKIEQIILLETSSLGLRYTTVTKSMLDRKGKTIDTSFGPIRIKEGLYKGRVIKYKAEHDDCVNAARKHNVPLSEVYKEVDKFFIQLR